MINLNIFDLDDLVEALVDNVKDDVKTFDDIVNVEACAKRELYLGNIGEGTGITIDGYITFWNRYDDEHNIPVDERQPIKIFINSYGGSLVESFIMMDAIEKSKTPVWTIATGACYSGGFFTFICGHKRIAYPHASFLFHEGSASNEGTASQFENFATFYRRQLNQLRDVVLEKTKISEDKYKEIQKDDYWLDVNDAIELGIVDEVAK